MDISLRMIAIFQDSGCHRHCVNSVVEMIGREMDGEKCQRMAGRIC